MSIYLDRVVARVCRGHVMKIQPPVGQTLYSSRVGGQRNEGVVRGKGDDLLSLTGEEPFKVGDYLPLPEGEIPRKCDVII